MSKKKTVNKSVETVDIPADAVPFTAESLKDDAIAACDSMINSLTAKGDEKSAKLARTWAGHRAQYLTRPSLFAAAYALCADGLVTAGAMRETLGALRQGSDAIPEKGFVKLADTILSLGAGRLSVSDLHRAVMLSLTDEYKGNDSICNDVARICTVSVTGTAPTQRSSSQFALQALGAIDVARESGNKGAMRWAANAIASRIQSLLTDSAPRIVKGAGAI